MDTCAIVKVWPCNKMQVVFLFWGANEKIRNAVKKKKKESAIQLAQVFFYLYIYPPDLQESGGDAIHRAMQLHSTMQLHFSVLLVLHVLNCKAKIKISHFDIYEVSKISRLHSLQE